MDNKNFKEDDYLSFSHYEGKPASKDLKGFSSFEHEGQFYFTLLDSAGKAFMRSEGYSSTKARDNGMESVNKNKIMPERWSISEQMKHFFLILKAGNHQEIAKSRSFKTKADAEAALASFMSGKPIGGMAVAAAALASKGTTSGSDVLKDEEKEDDYLPCKEYEGHTVNDKENNVALFKHENGQYYFALYNKDGSVKLRSEGFETAKNRDQELSGVLKYHNDDSMYTMLEKGKYFMMVLKDKSGNEVGRSCLNKTAAKTSKTSKTPKVTKAAAGVASGLAAGRVISETRNVIGEKRNVIGETRGEGVEKGRKVIGEKRNILSEKKSKIKEDDYLKCEAYKGHKITDTKNRVAEFKGKDGQLYFVVYNKDGSVRLRSEGFTTKEGRADELKHCIANMENAKRYSTIKRGKYFINVLKDGTGREVARSCMSKEVQEVVAFVPPPVKMAEKVVTKKKVVKPVAAAVVEETAAASGCWKWWWLPLLLLIPLLLFFWKGCGTTPPPPPPPPPPAPVVKTPPPPPPPPAPKCACEDLTHPIFKIPAGPAPKTTTVLGRAPEYGNSHSLDPQGFYNKLNAKYKSSAAERRFLDGISKQLGFEGGWKEVTPGIISAVNVPRGVSGNLGTKTTHKTVYRKLDPIDSKDLKAFRFAGKNACNLHFMKTCGNHFFYQQCE